MLIIYNVIIRGYFILIKIFSIWNEKAGMWIDGRKGWRKSLETSFKKSDKVIWFHCSSLGEFEQGRNIIEEVYHISKGRKILLTFFSPSGYEKQKHYRFADHIAYLPLDTKMNAKDFLDAVPVEYAVFIKYEFWYHFLNGMFKRGIPVYLASGNFRSNQLFFKWYGKWYQKMLGFFTHLFVQDERSKINLTKIGVTNVTVAGDSRFDRVIDIAAQEKNDTLFQSNGSSIPVMVAGSTWPQDEKIISEIYKMNYGKMGLVIAPHEPSEKHIEQIKQLFPNAILFTELNEKPVSRHDVIIVNTIGHLSSLYRFGDLAFIGGGFGKGIHNILEATASSLPVIFGPNYSKFTEAKELLKAGGAFAVRNANEAVHVVSTLLENDSNREKSAAIAREYTLQRKGATKIITDFISTT